MSDALTALIAELGADKALARTILAAALGDTKALGGRKPDLGFLRELLDRTEGKVTDKTEVKDTTQRSPEDRAEIRDNARRKLGGELPESIG